MNYEIKRAAKGQAKLRLALIGISGSGKTFSALSIAQGLGERILCIDTEHGSAAKYAEFGFDTIALDNYDPRHYVECIALAAANNYDVLIIDSLSHAWSGKGGALELVDKAAKRSNTSNTFGAWRDVTPLHNALIDAILAAPLHVIATMRAKTEYVQERGTNGKTVVRKVGMAPVQRDQMEYEFDVVGDMTQEHQLIITKSRCIEVADQVIDRPGRPLGQTLSAWLSEPAAATLAPGVHAAHSPDDRRATEEDVLNYEAARTRCVERGLTPPGTISLGGPLWKLEKRMAQAIAQCKAYDETPIATDPIEDYGIEPVPPTAGTLSELQQRVTQEMHDRNHVDTRKVAAQQLAERDDAAPVDDADPFGDTD